MGTDKNEQLGVQTDLEFNQSCCAMLLNNVFIKSDIGIDLYKVEKKSSHLNISNASINHLLFEV